MNMKLTGMAGSFAFWMVLGAVGGGLICSAVWFAQYSFLGQQGTKEDLWVFLSFGAIPGALVGVGVAHRRLSDLVDSTRLQSVAMSCAGLIVLVGGALYFTATLRKSDWREETARFERMRRDSDGNSEAIFSYSGGTASTSSGLWGYSRGDTKPIYVDPTRRSNYSFSNRPGYLGLAISVFVTAGLWFIAYKGASPSDLSSIVASENENASV